MDTFRNLLHAICKRPGMYVGTNSLVAVSHYLQGYHHAISDLANDGYENSPLAGWISWVELRFLISDPAWHWTHILLHVYGSERDVFDALPGLYNEFLEQRSQIGVAGIETESRRRILVERGEIAFAPEVMNTAAS